MDHSGFGALIEKSKSLGRYCSFSQRAIKNFEIAAEPTK
jgi:hypothetical protein